MENEDTYKRIVRSCHLVLGDLYRELATLKSENDQLKSDLQEKIEEIKLLRKIMVEDQKPKIKEPSQSEIHINDTTEQENEVVEEVEVEDESKPKRKIYNTPEERRKARAEQQRLRRQRKREEEQKNNV